MYRKKGFVLIEQVTILNELVDNQPFVCTTFVWKSKLFMELSCACIGPRHSPYSYYQCRAYDIVAVGTTFKVFSYDVVWADN